MASLKMWVLRIAAGFWIGLVLFSVGMFATNRTELQFLAAGLAGLAPMFYFIYLRVRPTTHIDIESTFTGAFCFAMNLIVAGQIALNGKPQAYLPFLALSALAFWLLYTFILAQSKAHLTSADRLLLKELIATKSSKTAVVFVTGSDDLHCAAMLAALEKEVPVDLIENVVIVSRNPFGVARGGRFRHIVSNRFELSLRYPSRFPLSSLGTPGFAPGLVLLDEKGEVTKEKWWDDVRKRQDASYIINLLK